MPAVITAPKPRSIQDSQWWERYTAPLLEFLVKHKKATWNEIRVWAHANGVPLKHVPDMVAFLDLRNRIHQYGAMWRVGPRPHL